MTVTLDTPLSAIKGIGPRMLTPLGRLGLHTVRDLLWHFPTRYDDFVGVIPIAELEGGTQATILATVESIETRRSYKKNLTITEAVLTDDTGSVTVTWFNPYIAQQLAPGVSGYFAGKVATRDGDLTLTAPVFERARDAGDQRHTGRLVPIYPETRGITSRGLRYLIMPILQELEGITDPLPTSVAAAAGYPTRIDALRTVHFPDDREDAAVALERFVFEELFLLQLANAITKSELATLTAPALTIDVATLKQLVSGVPFELTKSQKAALWDVIQDLGKPHPMNRLVQGDVGSGKTVVSVLASHVATRNGFQAALMAPTDILARQHFATFVKAQGWLEGTGVLPTVALLTGNHGEILYPEGLRADMKPAKIRDGIAAGTVDIAVGTHALISGSTAFKKLGLVTIDEQHRFGVDQRKALVSGGSTVPHFLSMTATPIPRTIMLTALGDLSTSQITELPAGRQPVQTYVVAPSGRDAMYREVSAAIATGRQVFIVCPLIEHADMDEAMSPAARAKREALLEAQSVTQVAESVRAALPQHGVITLHGKMKAAEKEAVMRDFVSGDVDILVSTTVIEVGVDVPNASIMIVESAERFGLAQLHQLRGRIGRGGHGGTCYLVSESSSVTARKRLSVLEKTTDGFALAEYDLKLRGPGEFLGTSQSGVPDLAMQHLTDTELVAQTREAAHAVLSTGRIDDPDLLRELHRFRKRVHKE